MFKKQIIEPKGAMLVGVRTLDGIKKNSRLVVPFGYEALFIAGNIREIYQPGVYNLAQSDDYAWVYFVNKAIATTETFKEDNLGLYLFDSYLNMPIEVCVEGMISFAVKDTEKVIESFANASELTGSDLLAAYKPVVYMEIKTELANLMKPEEINIFNTALFIKDASLNLQRTLNAIYDAVGIEVRSFYITSVSTTEALKDILDKEYADIQRLNIRDTYNNNRDMLALSSYEQKARIYKEYGFAGLTEAEKDREQERVEDRAKLYAETKYEEEPRPIPISPIAPTNINNTTVYRAPEVCVEEDEDGHSCACHSNIEEGVESCPFSLDYGAKKGDK
ncbi:MAG: SPFH domain-containing protein [Clostridia bacterium]|nr:SPFH domain-containing protein [Clostridia bacterium]